MADSDSESARDQFIFTESLTIVQEKLKMKTTINSSLLQRVDGTLYTNLNFYQSYAIAALLGSRMTHKGRTRQGCIEMKQFCDNLRRVRDQTFREVVMSKSTASRHYHGVVMPRHKDLRVIALQLEHVHVTMPAVTDVAGPCTINVLCSDERKNRHSAVWVELTASTCDYMSKVIASFECGDGSDAAAGPEDDEVSEAADAVQDDQREVPAALDAVQEHQHEVHAPLEPTVVNEQAIVAPHVDARSASTSVPEPASNSGPPPEKATLHAFFTTVEK